MQNSIQPIGARATSPTVMKAGRSDGLKGPPRDAVVSPAATVLAAMTKTAALARTSALAARTTCLKRLAIVALPLVGATFPTNPLYWC
jgi:hypothetical protein